MSQLKQIKVTLVKSTIGRLPRHVATVKALGLKRMNHSVVKNNTPEIQGMVNKVNYLLQVEEC